MPLNSILQTSTKYCSQEQDMLLFGKLFSQALQAEMVIYLMGPLGAGKTTLVRGILRGLGYMGKVKSPTYTLVEPYHLEQFNIFHFDLYRLQAPNELEQIGIREYFTPHSIALIEWPEKGDPFLPAPDLICSIALEQESRRIKLDAMTVRGEEILQKLQV